MKPPPSRPGRESDFDSTDTLPLPILAEDGSSTLDVPQLPPREDARPPRHRAQPRVAVSDSHGNTDTFQASALTPIAARPVAASDLAETLRAHEQQLGEAIERVASLEARLAESSRRCVELERECAALRAAPAAPAPIAPATHATSTTTAAETSTPLIGGGAQAHASTAERRELDAVRRQNEHLCEALGTMQARIGVHEAMLAEAEAALRAALASSSLHHPAQPADPAPAISAPATGAAEPREGTLRSEGTLRIDWQARFTELERVLEAERAAAADQGRAQASRLDALQAELEEARGKAQQARSLPIGSRLRVLVRAEEGTEVVYPLGRHTTIGRTPDNDIQVNTTFVSRHHAVLLTSSEHCIVEDLNSTNGIAVNGHRVGRQLLHDGDVVTIGKTNFRYETRS